MSGGVLSAVRGATGSFSPEDQLWRHLAFKNRVVMLCYVMLLATLLETPVENVELSFFFKCKTHISVQVKHLHVLSSQSQIK